MTTDQDVHCYWCEERLDADDAADPYLSDDEITCSDCYTEREQFLCCWCQEYGNNADRHNYLVVFDAKEAGIARPGLYRVTGAPYYCAPQFGRGFLFRSALTWVGDLLDVSLDQWYPCGHLCAPCQAKALTTIETYHMRCLCIAAP